MLITILLTLGIAVEKSIIIHSSQSVFEGTF